MAASRTIAVRLTLEEADQFRATLKAAGAEGEAALKKLSDAAKGSGDGLDKMGASGKLASYQLVQVSQEVHKFADQVLAGGSAMKAFVFQAPNIVSSAGGMKNALAALTSVFTPLRVGALVAVGGVTALVVAAETADARLTKLRNSLVGYTSDYAALATRIDASSRSQGGTLGIASSDVRSAQVAVAQALPGLSNEDLERSVTLARQFGLSLDQDIGAAVQRLGQLAKDPAATIKQLAEQGVPGLSASLVTQIDLMQRSGDRAGAYKLALDALLTSLGGAKQTSAQEGVARLRGEFERFWDGIEKGLAGPGEKFTRWLGANLKDINDLREKGAFMPAPTVIPEWAGRPLNGAAAGAPNASRELARISGDVAGPDGRIENPANRIYRVAEANGISPTIADLGTRVAWTESSGRQLDPKTGKVLTSSAGALGLGQLMPDTAKQYGVDPTDADQNVLGMLRYLTDLSKDKRFPTEADVAGAYNAGPDRYSKAMAGRGPLPSETANYIPAVTGRPRRDIEGPASVQVDQRDYVTAALKARQGSIVGQREAAEADITATQLNLRSAQAQGDPAQVAAFTEQLGKQKAALESLRTPAEQFAKELEDQAAAARAASGASGILASNLAKLEQRGRDTGTIVSDADRNRVAAATLATVNAEYRKSGEELGRSTRASLEQARAWGVSNDAGREAEARQRAYTDALKVDREGSPAFEAALKARTAAILNNAEASKAASAAAQLPGLRNDAATMDAQIDLAQRGAGPDETARALASLKASQSLDGVTDREVRSKVMSASLQNEEKRLKFQSIAANANELQTFASSAFDKIGSDITSAFTQGTTAAEAFGNIGKAVISELLQEMIKLSVINPLKNAILGKDSSLPTAAGVLEKWFGGSAATAAGASPFDAAGTTWNVPVAHSGAIIGSEAPATRMLNPAIFRNVPRYHGGGIANDEVPAVLRAGEGVFTPGQMKALGAGMGGGGASIQADFHYHAAPGGDGKMPSNDELERASKTWSREQEANVMAIIARERGRPGGMLWR